MTALATTQYIPGRSTPGKLAGIDLDAIIDRVGNGEYVAHIAKELGSSDAALLYRLHEHPQYQAAREISTEIRLDNGLMELESANDLSLARMIEVKLRRIEWRAEREFPHRWGAKQQVAVTLPGTIDAALAGLAIDLLAKIASNNRVIEHEPIDDDVAAEVEADRDLERAERAPVDEEIPTSAASV